MTLLLIMPDDAPSTVTLRTRDAATIADALRDRKVDISQWPLRGTVTTEMSNQDVIDLYRGEVDALRAAKGFTVIDAVALHPEAGREWQERARQARSAFLEEHRHAEDEVRFFAHGTGCFYLHLDRQVYAVVCEAGDLLSVPASTRHWFDMGPRPDFAAIRFFKEEDGWVGDFTGDTISRSFPRLDELLAAGQ